MPRPDTSARVSWLQKTKITVLSDFAKGKVILPSPLPAGYHVLKTSVNKFSLDATWSAQNTANYSCRSLNHNLHWAQWAYKPRRKLGDLVIVYNSTDVNLHDSFSNIGLFTSCRFFASGSKRVSVQKHSFKNQNCVPRPVSFHFMLIALIFIWKVFSEDLFWDREAQDN